MTSHSTIFSLGGAGVGKSHLIRALYQAAVKHNSRAGENFNEVKILLLAPTGKAAYGIKGNTVHSALAIPACQSLKTYKPLDSSRLNTLRCKLGAVQLIFLHEISLIGNTMLNVQINNRLKDIKGSKEVFGGISIIALGDLFQLKPVMDSYVFKDMKNSDYGSLAPNLWQEHFAMFELDEIMRQRKSREFAQILNRLREGNHTQDDIAKLKERCISEHCMNYLIDVPHLFIQNPKVDKFNIRVHRAEDIRKDLNYSNIDVNVFSETWLCYLDSDTDYSITGYTLFRNDSQLDVFNTRPCSGTAVYSKIPFLPGYPVCNNTGGVKITIIKVTMLLLHITIISVSKSAN